MLTTTELDSAQCQMPGCTHEDHTGELYLHQRCHPGKGCVVKYQKGSVVGDGYLSLTCSVCGEPVAEIAVSRE